MKVFIRRKNGINAVADFNLYTKECIVLKNSELSTRIKHSGSFRGAKSIEKSRKNVVDNNILKEDVRFKSPSTAANFVTGTSTNGMIAWKDENGKTIRQLMEELKNE